MYLKRLELRGFKSFAERVEINFEKGITVIVGPNGCGKSNLTDAVQWVLGEQSARLLRGQRMEDVIFSGTAKRRPLGMAEVSLTFDNSDQSVPLPFEEISITRRVYRSGEGEYYINKRSCRLRDIQELFAQCGISRAAFSITAQGKIDEFVSARPEERRVFLEELAGIGRYRQRKAEALRKLEETEDALARVEDIILEMETRRGPLEEQARVCEIYCNLRDEVMELERRLLKGQLADIRERERALQQTAQELDALVARDGKVVEMLEDEFDVFQAGLRSMKKSFERLEGEWQEIQKRHQEARLARMRTKDRISSCLAQEEELQEKLTVIRRRREETIRELEKISALGGRLEELLKEAKRGLEELEEEGKNGEAEREGLRRQLESLNKAIFDNLHQKTVLLSEIQGLNNKKELLLRQRESLTRRVKTAEERRGELEREIGEGEKLQSFYASSLEEIRNKLAQAEKRRQALNKELGETGLRIRSLLRKIEGIKERVRLLKTAEKNHEGYQQGVRSILREIARGRVLAGEEIRLAEELFTIEPAYETALETALGRASHYFVCSTPETAKKALEFLKTSGSGRASFLPLTAVERWAAGEHPRRFERFTGIIGCLSEIVSCEPKYRCVAEFLLGRTYLAEDLQAASRFAEHNDYRVRVVTLDGDLIQPGGLFTGGRSKDHGYPTTRRRKAEIERLDREMLSLKTELDELEEREKRVKDLLEENEERSRELQERRYRFEDARREAEQRIAALKQEWKQIDASKETSLLEREEQMFQEEDLDRRIELLKQKLSAVEQAEKQLNAEREKIEKRLADSEQKRSAVLTALSSAQVQYSSLSQELKLQQEKLRGLEHQLRLQEGEQREVEERLTELSGVISALRRRERELSERITALDKQGRELGDMIAFLKNKVAARERFVEARRKRIEKLRQIHLKNSQQLVNIELKLKHLLERKEQLLVDARERRLDVSEEQIKPLKREEEIALRERISTCKREMDSLGDINFAAPGEYKALRERIDCLLEQKKDLDEAKSSLLKMVREMDGIAADRFLKTFRMVRQNFEDIFQSLCEGRADLVLTDESNPLETGVDIVVLPRGKKPRHLSLLSGGEKSLTGIAFLFAMLKTQPAPFYFLDEIEAFLDEANLIRFTGFLKEWSASSQLILISHRYQTMQIADHLYGVTMEEPGVSKLVSVHLSDYLPDDERERQIS